MRSHKGVFITFEGVSEGIGKTVQSKQLAKTLREAGYDVVLTREPGGTAIGDKLRQIMLDPDNELSKATELFIMMAIRAQHYKEVLKPSLKAGKIVICDRYFDTTLAYQGAGRGWKSAFLWRLHHATTGSLMPDLTFVLNGTPHIARKDHDPDRIEAEGEKFFERARIATLHMSAKDKRFAVVDANVGIEALSQQILDIVHERNLLDD